MEPVERRLALVLRSFSEGGCEADTVGTVAPDGRLSIKERIGPLGPMQLL